MTDKAAQSPIADARQLVRRALKAALATTLSGKSHPYVSLVTVATDMAGRPMILISRLAVHTQNILADDRVSLMFDGTDVAGDPLAGGRVTVIGRARKVDAANARPRFLARHPLAEGYASFADFAFYEIEPMSAHFIGGFGRIVDIAGDALLVSLEGAEDLVASAADVVSHMNEDHAGTLDLYARALAGGRSGPWRMTGLDPEGFDIVCDGETRRLLFATPVHSAEAARREFIRMADAAQAGGFA